MDNTSSRPLRYLEGRQKLSDIKAQRELPALPKPPWLKIKFGDAKKIHALQKLLRKQKLHTVCEEAACPNLAECFSYGTATFMILGRLCTRHCPFCDVANGKPMSVDPQEPRHLADAVVSLKIKHVVITSVNRDDLSDGGAAHFSKCIQAVKQHAPSVRVEVLVPDFRNCQQAAITILQHAPPDVFNHNIETVPRLYARVRPGARYPRSLNLLKMFHDVSPTIPTKSGLMLGIGERKEEIESTLVDLFEHGCSMLTLGQYLRPSKYHLAVDRYVPPGEFLHWKTIAEKIGFTNIASGPLVRSSYHAEQQLLGD